jgi:beta-lactam-binding protein with PASTA domain
LDGDSFDYTPFTPFLSSMRDRFAPLIHAASNLYLWLGLLGLGLIAYLGLTLFDHVLMPTYTRQGESVEVPQVEAMPVEDALAALEARGLRAERVESRFVGTRPPNEVLEQEPSAGSHVKRGRLVYITVNSSERPERPVPGVVGLGVEDAQAQLRSIGFNVVTQADDVPSPYRNTVTRQQPDRGSELALGETVTLYYSTGPADFYVEAPDVTGLTVGEAQAQLRGESLGSIVVGGDGDLEATVLRQSPDPGTRVRGGHEVRLFTQPEEADGDLLDI